MHGDVEGVIIGRLADRLKQGVLTKEEQEDLSALLEEIFTGMNLEKNVNLRLIEFIREKGHLDELNAKLQSFAQEVADRQHEKTDQIRRKAFEIVIEQSEYKSFKISRGSGKEWIVEKITSVELSDDQVEISFECIHKEDWPRWLVEEASK